MVASAAVSASAESAADVSHPRLCHLDDAPADAARVHQLPGENEERHCQKREAVDARHEVLREKLRVPEPEAPGHGGAGEHECEGHGHADAHDDEHRDHEDDGDGGLIHVVYSTSDSWPRSMGAPRTRFTMAITPMATEHRKAG